MRIFRISNVMILLIAATFGVFLFWTSQDVQKKERELAKIKAALAQEQETIRVLSVEWDYLNRPQRLEDLAKQERAALYKARRDLVFRQMTDTASLKIRRHNIARILTVIAEKKGGNS